MSHPEEIVIKTTPVVFLKRLVAIELFFALSTTLLALWIDIPDAYTDLQLERFGSLTLLVSIAITTVQILIVAAAFITWYFDKYTVSKDAILHQKGSFFGVSDVVKPQALAEVNAKQSKLGRTFNYGTLELVTIDGDKPRRLHNLPNPYHQAEIIKSLIAPKQLDINRQLQQPILDMIAAGEGQYVEFKSSFSWDYRRQRINKDLNKAVMKNVVGFMNTTGGAILMGVDDEGQILGLEKEMKTQGKPNRDGFENGFNMVFNKMVGAEFRHYLVVEFKEFDQKTVCRVLVMPSPQPVYLNHNNNEEFYIRTGNSSQPLTVSKAVNYIQTHFD
jgi:hypothetical protein